MNRETLSISQANVLLQTLGDILDHCASNMNNSLNEFLINLSRMWEDRISRDLGRNIFRQSQEIMSVLGKNYNTMAQTLEDIVRYYKAIGGIEESFFAVHRVYRSDVKDDILKEYFSDGNGDDFGFKDIYNGPDQVVQILEDYLKKIREIADETKESISRVKAFGNQAITNELADSGKRIVEIVQESIEIIKKDTKEHIDYAAKAYGKIGKEAYEELQKVRTAINE